MAQFCYLRVYLCIETVSCRLLKRMAKMDIDQNLNNMGQLFKFLCYASNKSPKILSVLGLPT